MISSTIALIAAGLSLASAQDPSTGNTAAPACLNLETASEASAFARGVQLMSLQKGTVNPICFGGGSVKLDAVPDIVQVFASDPAAISGKFTDAAGTVTPLRCEFPKDSITELLKTVNGGVPEIAKVKFSCKKADGNVFLSWNGVSLSRGGSTDPEPTKPVDPTGGTDATDKPVQPTGGCLNVADVLNSPLLVFSNRCFNVLAIGGTFTPTQLDLQAILKDVQASKPITVAGTYARGDAKFQVSCTVDSSTIALILPLLQKSSTPVDLSQVRKQLKISCATADGKHQFGIDGDDISGVDVDGTTVTVGGVKVNLAGVAHRIINGKALEVFGFTVKDGVLVTPSGQTIKFDSSDVLDFLENAVAVVQKDGSITISGDRGTITYKDGKVTFTGTDGKQHQLGEECQKPTRIGNALSVTCKNGQFSIDAQGKQVVGKQVRDVNADADVKGYIGAIKKATNCDVQCAARVMAALRAYLGPKKCDAAASESSIIITCDGALDAAAKNTVLDGSVATVNNSNGSADVEPASIEDRAEPLPAARGAAASLALAAGAALVAMFGSLL